MQRGGHVDARVVVVGALEAYVPCRSIGADARKEIAETHATPLADRAPALDADVARNLGSLRQGVELGQRPGLLVANKALELQLVVLAVHQRDLFHAVEGVEGEGLGDRALGKFRRELVRVEEPALRAVVPARHPGEQSLHALVVGEVAAREHCERSQRQSLPEEEAPLDAVDEFSGMPGQTRFHGAFFHVGLLARPVNIVGKVRGTRITMAIWINTMSTSSDIARK